MRWLAFALATSLNACKGKEPPKVSLNQGGAVPGGVNIGALPSAHPNVNADAGLGATARAALDSGNAAFRAKNYKVALRYYRTAAESAPAHAAPWFGIFMIAQATGNTALADSATAEVRRRTVDPAEVTDSTLRSTHPAPKSASRKRA
jgi:hypothetical protein